jgi:hypothetical protein
MSKTLAALLFPFLNIFQVVEGGEAAPAPEGEQQPQATEENVAPPEKSETETASDEQPESKLFTEEEVNKIVQKRLSKLERKLERQQIEQETRAKVQQEQQVQAPADDPEPKESEFESYSDYLKALAKHEARAILRAERLAEVEKAARQSQISAQEREAARQAELIEKGESKFDDFEDVIKADRNEYSRAAYLSMLESDIGAELLYHLATNPEEGKRIAALPAFAQAKEIGKLEDKLLAKPAKKQSNAPEPIKPVTSGKASNDTVLSDDLPLDEWVRRRNKQLGR